jgi:hypothetical protein
MEAPGRYHSVAGIGIDDSGPWFNFLRQKHSEWGTLGLAISNPTAPVRNRQTAFKLKFQQEMAELHFPEEVLKAHFGKWYDPAQPVPFKVITEQMRNAERSRLSEASTQEDTPARIVPDAAADDTAAPVTAPDLDDLDLVEEEGDPALAAHDLDDRHVVEEGAAPAVARPPPDPLYDTTFHGRISDGRMFEAEIFCGQTVQVDFSEHPGQKLQILKVSKGNWRKNGRAKLYIHRALAPDIEIDLEAKQLVAACYVNVGGAGDKPTLEVPKKFGKKQFLAVVGRWC